MRELFQYRELIKSFVIRDLKIMYKNSYLGFFWSFLNPLCRAVVFYIIFDKIFHVGIEHFVIYLLCAILAWMFFADSLNCATFSIVNNAGLIKKVYSPLEIYPLSSILTRIVNFLLSLVVLFLWILFCRIKLNFSLLYLPLIILIQLIFTIGIGFFLAAAYVFFRDLGHLLELILLVWFYFTPIFYKVEMVPIRFRFFYLLNPMAALITFYRDLLLYSRYPDLKLLGITTITSLISLVIGWSVFNFHSQRFAEEI